MRFPDAFVKTLPRVSSNHHPLCINFHPETMSNFQRPFLFIAAWQEHDSFSNLLNNCWEDRKNLVENLAGLTPALLDLNKNVFGARIKGIQEASSYDHNRHLDDLEMNLSRGGVAL